MTESSTSCAEKRDYELCFTSLANERRAFAFPCDQAGKVDLDELTERSRTNYLYARAVVGKELSAPIVAPVPTDRRSKE